jgi:Ran GTPase-activating protein (RanGAP) involved in mRNA processing and transport
MLALHSYGMYGIEWSLLAQVALESDRMRVFCRIPLTTLREGTLPELSLSGQGVGVHGALVLSKLIHGGSLSTLDLSRNVIGARGANALAEALKVPLGSLRALNLAEDNLCGVLCFMD